jgi:hypothetical protein
MNIGSFLISLELLLLFGIYVLTDVFRHLILDQ